MTCPRCEEKWDRLAALLDEVSYEEWISLVLENCCCDCVEEAREYEG